MVTRSSVVTIKSWNSSQKQRSSCQIMMKPTTILIRWPTVSVHVPAADRTMSVLCKIRKHQLKRLRLLMVLTVINFVNHRSFLQLRREVFYHSVRLRQHTRTNLLHHLPTYLCTSLIPAHKKLVLYASFQIINLDNLR